MQNKLEQRIIEQVAIEAISTEEKSLARVNGKVIFVDNALPGDVVDIRVYKDKKKFAKATAIKWHKFSENRATPFCKHFEICGGCQWQDLQYAQQLIYKQQIVLDAFNHIGKLENVPAFSPILGSAKTERYRNKLHFGFSTRKAVHDDAFYNKLRFEEGPALGFHIPKYFDKIIDITECNLEPEPSNAIRNFIREYTLENNFSYHNLRDHEGLMRDVVIRITSTQEVMVIICFYYQDEMNIELLNAVLNKFPEIQSLNYVINTKMNDFINDLPVHLFYGKPFIIERLGDLQFKISPQSFFQTNSAQAVTLYNVVKDFANIQHTDLVYDLYTGTGSIALYVASKAAKVIGVEYVQAAIDDAYENARINGISNCSFVAGDLATLLNADFVSKNGKPSVIITDPPRAGMHPKVIDMLLNIEAPKIVYVSCNPATQARDLEYLQVKYSIEKVQPVDMFPQTTHIENVVLLQLKK